MDYSSLITAISAAHQQAQAGAAGAVNRCHVLRNWLIGAYLVEFEQNGEGRAEYGEQLLPRLAKDLARQQIPGCSREMLGRMRLLFRLYPQLEAPIRSSPMTQFLVLPGPHPAIRSSAMTESGAPSPSEPCPPKPPPELVLRFSWTHLIELIRIEDPWKRAFYENECLHGNWSVRQLQRQVGSLLYERTGLSTDKQAVIERGRDQAAKSPLGLADLIRDPYVLEFTGLAEKRGARIQTSRLCSTRQQFWVAPRLNGERGLKLKCLAATFISCGRAPVKWVGQANCRLKRFCS